MILNNENEIRLWSLTFVALVGNGQEGEEAALCADFAVKKLRTRLEERRGKAFVFSGDREALKLRARQVEQDLGHAEASQGGPEPYLSLLDVKTGELLPTVKDLQKQLFDVKTGESSPMVKNLQKQLLDAIERKDKPEINRILPLVEAAQRAARKDEK